MNLPLDNYLYDHVGELPPVLEWLENETLNQTGHHSKMLAGPILGRFLIEFSKLVAPKKILEIGTFTGYSAICLAQGLTSDGVLDALEKDERHISLIKDGIERAGLTTKINLHFGDAKELIPQIKEEYDIVFIDANKREYCSYYNLAFNLVKPGGYILADNVLWYGKVTEAAPPKDAQTQGILKFNEMVKNDRRVSGFILPLRDGLYIIRKL
ncbi:MAG: class I SAM-dependent methyltransferase [Bacteroidales bacterium]|jgi:predicted O-methyltransferase YrrM|nr:class I SAM-dependent methyltransferase [Bacteroidales bacterium]